MKLGKKKLTPRKEPNQERAKETVEIIVEATAHILEKEGFEKTSTNKIAVKAGVSIGSLYQYFPTKDAIFSFMMDRYVKDQTRMVNKILEDTQHANLKETLHAVISAILETKKKEVRFNKMFAQKLMSFAKYEALNSQDENLIELFKHHLKPYWKEIRTDNIDLTLYFTIQTVKCLPLALMFQNKFELRDPRVLDELVQLTYSYLKKN